MRATLIAVLTLACGACATTQPAESVSQQPTAPNAAATQSVALVKIPTSAPQAGLVFGSVPPGSVLGYDGRAVRVGADGSFVVGVAREKTGTLSLKLTTPDGNTRTLDIAIVPRTFPIERVNGVDENSVNPPPAISVRIMREQAEVDAVRTRDDDRADFATAFTWPVKGRISGVFGSQRIYNGTPASPHSGVDVAAAQGTPIHAPAGGIVTFANPDLYLTGGTVLIDHGFGLSSSFLHMSHLDVKMGDRIAAGQVIGAAGMTGRATGPHVHWGFNWFDVRLDPALLAKP